MNITSSNSKRAYRVSFDRPDSDSGAGYFFEGDYKMVCFLEKNSYNVAYATSVDLASKSQPDGKPQSVFIQLS